jgi:hypothetical protein
MAGAVTVTDTSESDADTDTYTFSTQSLGAEAADRYIVIGASAREGSATLRNFSSVTVGGNAATSLVEVEATAGQIGLFGIAVPTGTTADVVVTFDGANSRCTIAVFRIVGADTTTPTDTSFDSENQPAVDTTLDLNLDVVDEGVIAAYAAGGTVGTLVIDYDGTLTDGTQQSVEVWRALTGIHDASATESPRTVSATFDTTASDIFGPRAVAVSFPPSAAPPAAASFLMLLGVGT